MGVILGRQSNDFGRIRILVYGSLVQKSLNGLNDSIMIIVETEINLYKTDCNLADIIIRFPSSSIYLVIRFQTPMQ